MFSTFYNQVQNEKEFRIIKVKSDHGGEFENKIFEFFFMKMEFLMIPLVLELLNKVELWNERIKLYKKWPEPWSTRLTLLNTFGQRQLIQRATFRIEYP